MGMGMGKEIPARGKPVPVAGTRTYLGLCQRNFKLRIRNSLTVTFPINHSLHHYQHQQQHHDYDPTHQEHQNRVRDDDDDYVEGGRGGGIEPRE
jgi:hypothetical protein